MAAKSFITSDSAATPDSHSTAAQVLAAASVGAPAAVRRAGGRGPVAKSGQSRPHHPDEHGQAERASPQRLFAAKVSEFEFGAATIA